MVREFSYEDWTATTKIKDDTTLDVFKISGLAPMFTNLFKLPRNWDKIVSEEGKKAIYSPLLDGHFGDVVPNHPLDTLLVLIWRL